MAKAKHSRRRGHRGSTAHKRKRHSRRYGRDPRPGTKTSKLHREREARKVLRAAIAAEKKTITRLTRAGSCKRLENAKKKIANLRKKAKAKVVTHAVAAQAVASAKSEGSLTSHQASLLKDFLSGNDELAVSVSRMAAGAAGPAAGEKEHHLSENDPGGRRRGRARKGRKRAGKHRGRRGHHARRDYDFDPGRKTKGKGGKSKHRGGRQRKSGYFKFRQRMMRAHPHKFLIQKGRKKGKPNEKALHHAWKTFAGVRSVKRGRKHGAYSRIPSREYRSLRDPGRGRGRKGRKHGGKRGHKKGRKGYGGSRRTRRDFY